jgi:hypothetical protein
MTDDLQGALTEALNRAIEGAASASQFLLSETPDAIKELLAWKLAESLLINVVAISAVLFVIYAVYRACHVIVGEDGVYDHPEVMLLGFAAFPIALALMQLNLDWLQIWIAPKIYLIEYAAGLVK